MDNTSMDSEQVTWYSSYGSVTVERIFDLLGIRLSQPELQAITHQPDSKYYQLLQVPLKNIFNGILLSQTTDYREYAQKMLIDYLMSGAANLSEEQTAPEGARLFLEDMRVALMSMGDQFDLLQFEHHKLILDSQKKLIKLAKTLSNDPSKSLEPSQTQPFIETITPFLEQTTAVTLRIKTFRAGFYDMILKIKGLLDSIPEYLNTFETQPEHLEAIDFDQTLGEEVK